MFCLFRERKWKYWLAFTMFTASAYRTKQTNKKIRKSTEYCYLANLRLLPLGLSVYIVSFNILTPHRTQSNQGVIKCDPASNSKCQESRQQEVEIAEFEDRNLAEPDYEGPHVSH